MLRERDYLLTLAAIWLLFAALESSSRSKLTIAASAHKLQQQQQPHVGDRTSSAGVMQMDLFMSKIKKNIDNQQQQSGKRFYNLDKRQHQLSDEHNLNADTTTSGNQTRQLAGDSGESREQHQHQENNSYNYYANEADNQVSSQTTRPASNREQQFKEAHGVPVHFLRSAANRQDDNHHQSPSHLQQDYPRNATNILYLLNEHSQAQQLPQVTRASLSSLDGLASVSREQPASVNELLSPAEQQQQPPFTMFAPGGASPNGLADQQQNIRQILANYQRAGYPQLTDQQRQLLTQLAPRPPELHLRPPTTPAPALPALGGLLQPPSQQQQQQLAGQQQPFSALQLLTNPLQAFLPGLGTQQSGQQQPASNANSPQKAPSDGASQPASPTVPVAPNARQQPSQFNLLNPFNLPQMQPPPASGPVAGGGGQPPGALGNLQEFYQQLPLYQALLAARQRQEALQAAQRMRQQQQQQHQVNGGFRNPLMPSQPPHQLNPPLPQPPAQSVHNNAAVGGGGDQNGWSPPPAAAHQQPPNQQPGSRPTSNQAGPVHFDDDDEDDHERPGRQQQHQKPAPQGHVNNNSQQDHENNKHDQDHDDSADQNNNSQNNDSSTGQNNSNNDQGNEQHQPGEAGGQGGTGASSKAEEEDPDLKSFQNLANGGDDFAGLFPPGILSNNDINEIKTQQAEQAKKQEQEERQKQLREQQQFQHQQPAVGQQQQHDNQPMNQFANGGNQQQQPLNENNNNNNNDGGGGGVAQDDNNQQEQPDDNSEEGEGGEDNPQEGEGDQQQDDGAGQQEDSPSAAALTAKSSSSSSETTKAADGWRQKFTESPGVEYATTNKKEIKSKKKNENKNR